MSRYTAATADDLRAMLAAIGVGSLEELFERQVPAGVRLGRALDLPAGLPEQDVYAHLRELAARNVSAEDEITFLGAGMYDHYVPAVVDMLMERSEFLTPYTPYQPEVSQGGAAGDVRVPDGDQRADRRCRSRTRASTRARAPSPPPRTWRGSHNGKRRVVVSRGVHPHSRETLRTLRRRLRARGRRGRRCATGSPTSTRGPRRSTRHGAVIFQNPNFLGAVEDAAALARRPQGLAGASWSAPTTRSPLGILEPPGECGVDVAVGEGQSLGNRLDFGGPSFGFFAATEAYLRRMPGRIAGETRDVDGRRGFVLTLQTREQHIRREKATSNICTAQALNALAGVVYLSWLGRHGLVELAELLLAAHRTTRARR